MRPLLIAAASGFCLIPTFALAEEPRGSVPIERPMCGGVECGLYDPAVPVTVVEMVLVTRAPTLPVEAIGATVITRQEIALRQASEPADVLQLVPGLAVTRTGAFGGLTAVRQRGASTDKTLVLIDGIPLNDASQPAGGYDLSGLDLVDVERVEVLSGPQGSLWGSDAIGGVINFVTRAPTGWRASLEGGSFGYVRGDAGAGLQEGPFQAGFAAAGWRADGLSQADRRDGNTEADGAWAYTLSARGRFQVSRDFDLFAQARFQRSHTDTDGFPAPNFTLADTDEFAHSRSWLGDIGAHFAGPWRTDHTLRFSLTDIDRANLGGDFPSAFQARREVWRYEAATDPNRPIVAHGGVEYQRDRASISDGSEIAIHNTSAFLVVQARPAATLHLTGSLRYDDPSSVGGRLTGRASAVWDATSAISFNAAWGQGFKVPTISQLACDFCFPGGASVGLRPERAQGYEAGVRLHTGLFDGRLTAYHLSVEDQIDFSASFPFRYLNLKETRSNGVEASASFDITDAWRLEGEYAWTDALDVVAQTRLLRIPEHAGSVSLSWQGERIGGILTVRAESDQADAGGSRDGFVVADIAGQYDVTRRIQLTARIENLTDTHYQQALGYGEPGIAAYVGVRIRGE